MFVVLKDFQNLLGYVPICQYVRDFGTQKRGYKYPVFEKQGKNTDFFARGLNDSTPT
jgi:hypothetical protein